MKTINLERSGQPALEFTGELVAGVTSNPHDDKDRWTELQLYKTNSGRYVMHVLGQTVLPDEHVRAKADVIDDIEKLPGVLGYTNLAKQLYAKINLVVKETLD